MAMSRLITVCIAHFRDVDFILNTLYCLKHLTKNPYQVFIRDNNSGAGFYHKLKNGIREDENIHLFRAEKGFNLRGGLAHGTALNDLVSRIDTPYGVILDADCTFLVKGWDEILIDKLNDRVRIIGTKTNLRNREDFPFIQAVLFETEILKKLNIDFRPKDLSKWQDTGWELKIKYMRAGYGGETIGVENTRVYKEGPFWSLVGVEEYYMGKARKKVFATHFGRGSTLGSAKYQKGKSLESFIYGLPVVGRLPRRWKGKRERKRWIEICRGIVNKQVKQFSYERGIIKWQCR